MLSDAASYTGGDGEHGASSAFASTDSGLERGNTAPAGSAATYGKEGLASRHGATSTTTTATTATTAVNGAGTGAGQERHLAAATDGTDAVQDGAELWTSILNSVKSSRATPVKNVIVLGQAQSGKSTLLSSLSSSSPSGFVSDLPGVMEPHSPDVSIGSLRPNGHAEANNGVQDALSADLGLGYGYFDVGDDDGEDTIARVGVYQVNAAHRANLALLPFALSAGGQSKHASTATGTGSHSRVQTNGERRGDEKATGSAEAQPSVQALRDSLFLIVLDWEAPWTFLSQLLEWLDVIRETIDNALQAEQKIDAGQQQQRSSPQVVLDELKEKLESYIRSYTEPTTAADGLESTATEAAADEGEVGETSTASAIVAVSNPTGVDEDDKAPLPEGCLTHNFGVPIVVVCTKADTISQLERQRNFKEEQFDYIQQVLRTICLKYGAGLFFTAQTRPQSFDILRQYILHRLFSSARHHSATGAFHFRHRASTVERDVLLVPAGWDSFGKIRALREGFDCAIMANGWEWDVQVERIRRKLDLAKGSQKAEEIAEQQVDRRSLPGLVETDVGVVGSAVKLYEDIIEDWDASVPPVAAGSSRIKEPDDQAFLMQHYTSLQREPESRARGARAAAAGASPSSNAAANALENARSVVGPLGSSSLSLPGVEKAMQERRLSDEGNWGMGNAGAGAKSASRRDAALRAEHSAALRIDGTASAGTPGRPTPTPMLRGTPGTANGAPSSGLQSPSLSSSERGGTSRPTSPLGAGASPGSMSPSIGTPKQSEVLHSFFQSLLKEKPAQGGGGGGGGGAAALGRSSQPNASARSGTPQSGSGRP